MHELDLIGPQDAFEHREAGVVRTLVELNADFLVGQLARRIHLGVWTYIDALANNGGPLADDRAWALLIIGAADLTPFAGAINIALLLLKHVLIVERIHF